MTVVHEYKLPRRVRVDMEDVPLPGMPEPKQTKQLLCSATHKGFHCVMVAHPEIPDQHYYVSDES